MFFTLLFEILIVEIFRYKFNLNAEEECQIFSWSVISFGLNVYKFLGCFLFGAVSCDKITETTKFLTGRLRPHFISVSLRSIILYIFNSILQYTSYLQVCQPILFNGSNYSDLLNKQLYIEEYIYSRSTILY